MADQKNKTDIKESDKPLLKRESIQMGLLYLAHYTLIGLYMATNFFLIETGAMLMEKSKDILGAGVDLPKPPPTNAN